MLCENNWMKILECKAGVLSTPDQYAFASLITWVVEKITLSICVSQVCSHIVQAIRKETLRVRDEWEAGLNSGGTKSKPGSDAYCFELLSMVLALSGSEVGSGYLAQQHSLLQDLLSLLHTASPRVQRQVGTKHPGRHRYKLWIIVLNRNAAEVDLAWLAYISRV